MTADPPPPGDLLDLICRQMLAETLLPCREVPRDVRAGWAALAADRNAALHDMGLSTGVDSEMHKSPSWKRLSRVDNAVREGENGRSPAGAGTPNRAA